MIKKRFRLVRKTTFELQKFLILANVQCSTIVENTLDFSYEHIFTLMQSTNPMVRLKATNALASFIYNNPHVESLLSKNYELSFDYFQKFFQNNDDHIRCAAAFQVCFLYLID